MQELSITIKNKLGLHARPAAMLVQTAGRFKAKIKIIKEDQEVDGKSIMGIMTLAAGFGSQLSFIVDGEDEQQAVAALKDLVERGFGEE
ncbi:MAG: HPr family phosphocarrier protein [Endomicrobiales bacterium]|jgi:phosphocarrier protein